MRLLLFILLLIVPFSLFAAPSEQVITDPKITGYKANVNKLGTSYGLAVDSTPATTIFINQVTVTTAGTRVQLSGASTPIRSICVKALTGNTGKMYVGDVTVASSNGYELPKDVSVCLDVNNINLIYVDSSVNGEKVSYVAVN